MSERLPITATQHELPFLQLSWEQFERLCLRLVHARGYQGVEHLGRSGNDRGLDVVAWDRGVRVAVQCKRVKDFAAADGLREIKKLLALDELIRPQRVIFMVTSGISSNARDQIRRAWGGGDDSCEFVAITELDAAVRANGSILREFFGTPAVIHTPDRHHMVEPRELHEVSRIEIANREWITTTGSYHFQRLLQAIQEVGHLAGRLEAGRALNHAIRRSGATHRTTELKVLQICDELDSHEIFQLNWKLRRMLARVVGDVIGLQIGIGNQRLVDRFCEPRLETPRGSLLLAEAAAEHTAAASVIGAPVLRRLLLSRQPQVPWQLLRRWPLVSPVLSKDIALEEMMQVSNASIRRMLLLTNLQGARQSSAALKRFLDGVRDGLNGKPAAVPDVGFHRTLVAWAAMNTSVDSPSRGLRRDSFFRVDQLLDIASWSGRGGDALIHHVAEALELDSIERDLRNAGGDYQTHPNEQYGEGRYGYTRHYVRAAFRVAPRHQVGAMLMSLLDCADEGIRWAMASEVLNWWPLVPDRSAAIKMVLRLVGDGHPWVVREVLQQLTTDALLCQAIGTRHLAQLAEDSRSRANAEGWATAEMSTAIRGIAALAPA